MRAEAPRATTDILAVVSTLTIGAFVIILCLIAARDPVARPMLIAIGTGVVAGGLILFRQLRKATSRILASEARAQYAATHDALTQLPNTAALMDRLADAMRRSSDVPPQVMVIGMDRFDETHEVLGLEAGDAVVRDVARRTAALARPTDLLARVRHDMFALVLLERLPEQADRELKVLLARLAEDYPAALGKAFISCSVGVCSIADDIDTPVEGLRRAQLALSHSRRNGGGTVSRFDVSMDHVLRDRKFLEVELRAALDAGALTLAYQPQVNARGGLVGVEALMRWRSDGRGEISPATFIPIAEACGLSSDIARFALRQAMSDSLRWPNLKTAVNLSIAEIRSGSLPGMLKMLLAETGAQARNIELEITEGVFLDEGDEVYETLSTLHRLGFSIALDDFGTGYSSLAYLRRFPVDKIKIDRSFVSQLGMRPESSAIIRAIVDLAEALELQVMAEGVETRAQVDRLLQVGCQHYQGFHFSPAIPAEAIDEMVASGARLAA